MAYTDPWRVRRALGVNEGRSCDRSIFPKSRGGPIRRYIKAGRIISNLYCRRIRTSALARSLSRSVSPFPPPPSLSISPSFRLSRSLFFLARPPSFSKPLCKITSYTRRATSEGEEMRDGAGLAGRSRRRGTRGERDGTRLSYAIANYRQFDPVITQFKVIGPR